MSCKVFPLDDGRAVLGCSTYETVFGPIFESESQALAFIAWLGQDLPDTPADEPWNRAGVRERFGGIVTDPCDPRSYNEEALMALHSLFLGDTGTCTECGEPFGRYIDGGWRVETRCTDCRHEPEEDYDPDHPKVCKHTAEPLR